MRPSRGVSRPAMACSTRGLAGAGTAVERDHARARRRCGRGDRNAAARAAFEPMSSDSISAARRRAARRASHSGGEQRQQRNARPRPAPGARRRLRRRAPAAARRSPSDSVCVSPGMFETKVMVAPNSPSALANASTAPATMPGHASGRVIAAEHAPRRRAERGRGLFEARGRRPRSTAGSRAPSAGSPSPRWPAPRRSSGTRSRCRTCCARKPPIAPLLPSMHQQHVADHHRRQHQRQVHQRVEQRLAGEAPARQQPAHARCRTAGWPARRRVATFRLSAMAVSSRR